MQAKEGKPQIVSSYLACSVDLSSYWRGWGRLSLGLFLSGGVILWLVKSLDFRQVLLALQEVDFFWVGFSLLTVLFTLWARALRWRALLDSNRVSTSGTMQALVLGQLLNQIFPARLGDLGRAYLITREGYTSQAQALGTVALEKLWDILLLVGCVLALSFWQPLPSWLTVPAQLAALGGGILLAGILALLLLRRYLAAGWTRLSQAIGVARWQWLERLIGQLLDGLAGLHRPGVMLTSGGWSVLVWLFGALTNLALLRAFDLPFSIGIALFLLVVLQMGVAVPSLPGRIGVFEGLCLITLALFDVKANLALGYGVMLHGVVLLPPVVLGLWWLLRLDSASRQAIWKST